jgi:hypothetical protein
MAFIRQYSVRSTMGDPLFGIKLPKLPIGRLLGKVASPVLSVASFVPGPIGIAGKLGKMAKIVGVAKTGAKLLGAGAALGAGTTLAEKALTSGVGPGMGWVVPTQTGGTTTSTAGIPGVARARKKYRRMNVTNMKALTRASRRVHKFAKIARTCIRQSQTVRCPKKGARGRKNC